MLSLICMKTNLIDFTCKIYKDNKSHSMVGIYDFTLPTLMILEPELVKTVLQTNFSSFSENTINIDPINMDPLIAHNPLCVSGEKWLSNRKRLTYAFSNMRLKILFESVKQVCMTMENYIDKKLSNVDKTEFELKGSDGVVCRMQPGMEIIIPVQALHKDPQYWENPEEYEPERFNSDKKNSINRFTYLPFSEGQRICVGIRMAQLQIKAGLAMILRKYSLELSLKTQIPLKMISETMIPTPKGGLWVYFRHL